MKTWILSTAIALAVSAASAAAADCRIDNYKMDQIFIDPVDPGINVSTVHPSANATVTFSAYTPPPDYTLIDICASGTANYRFDEHPPGGSTQSVAFTFGSIMASYTYGALHTDPSASPMFLTTLDSGATSFTLSAMLTYMASGPIDLSAGIGDIHVYAEIMQMPPMPEPETWALLIAGGALTGAALRRRRAAIAHAADASGGRAGAFNGVL